MWSQEAFARVHSKASGHRFCILNKAQSPTFTAWSKGKKIILFQDLVNSTIFGKGRIAEDKICLQPTCVYCLISMKTLICLGKEKKIIFLSRYSETHKQHLRLLLLPPLFLASQNSLPVGPISFCPGFQLPQRLDFPLVTRRGIKLPAQGQSV